MTVISETKIPYFHPVTTTITICIAPKGCHQFKIIISSPEVENPIWIIFLQFLSNSESLQSNNELKILITDPYNVEFCSLSMESLNRNKLWCDHSNETCSAVISMFGNKSMSIIWLNLTTMRDGREIIMTFQCELLLCHNCLIFTFLFLSLIDINISHYFLK